MELTMLLTESKAANRTCYVTHLEALFEQHCHVLINETRNRSA